MVKQFHVSRRHFLGATGATVAAAAFAPNLFAGPSSAHHAETHVQELFGTLSEQQRSQICFSFDHQLRHKINANWHVTKPTIGDDFYSDQQRKVIGEIVRGMCSEDGFERLEKQMEDDDGGLNFYSIALFGDPTGKKFEFELTGRHLTMRADGNSVDKAAFGGPIVYGHGDETPEDNLYFYQTQQVNKVFDALDSSQRKAALLKNAPREAAVQLQGTDHAFAGLAVSSMTADQQQLVNDSLGVLLAPYRESDRQEVLQIIEGLGGVQKLNFAFYQQGDLNSDKVWDIWRIEGPGFVWHFRGAPHVHAYINIAALT